MKFISEKSISGASLRLVTGDITAREVDAIVNAANSQLQHGGGVADAIVRKGGAVIQQESDEIGYVPVGQAAITTAGLLPARFVIHAVGPMLGEGDEDCKLESAVRSSLQLAEEKHLQSISLPAISSGIFGFPKDRCAEILVNTAVNFLRNGTNSCLRVIEFCILDNETLAHFQREFDKITTR
jgi:O-acetyl-ADP-ribose deacetylase (regulator of RNase III)